MTATAQAKTAFCIVIPATPHPVLSPNVAGRATAKRAAKRDLREAAYLATNNLVVRNSWLIRAVESGMLDLTYQVYWERGRQWMDGDNLASCMKGCTDGIAHRLNIDDRHFVFWPIQQHDAGERQGWIVVDIVVSDRVPARRRRR